MEKERLMYVVGDSHVRSFAYHDFFMPLCIGGSMENCFLTKEKKEQSETRLIANLKKLSPEHPILLVLGEADTRHYWHKELYSQKELDKFFKKGQDELKDMSHEQRMVYAAGNYMEVLLSVKKVFSNPIYVFSVVPTERERQNELAQIYNGELQRMCAQNNIDFIDIWPQTFDPQTKRVRKQYQAEFIHLNETIGQLVFDILKEKKLIPASLAADTEHAWSYPYAFMADKFRTRIWGDYEKQHLTLKGSETHFWERYHQKTQLHGDCIKELKWMMPVIQQELKRKPGLLVLDCQEGFAAFNVDNREFTQITGVDASDARIRFAKELNRIYSRDVRFSVIHDSANDELPQSDMIISLDKSSYRKEHRAQLMENAKKHGQIFFFLSFKPQEDCRLAMQAGFKACYRVPFLLSKRMDIHDNTLLCALNFEPSFRWKMKFRMMRFRFMRSYVYNAWKRVRDFNKM